MLELINIKKAFNRGTINEKKALNWRKHQAR